jgi:hypothetical protein
MERYAGPLAAFIVFITIYAFLQRRRGGQIQWGWLAAVVLCAGAAIALGFIM